MKSEKLKKNDKDKKKQNKKISDPKTHYINNKEFERLINEYYSTDIFSDELGEMIMKIATHATYMPRFINYTYKDSMISDSIYKMVKALNERKFDPSKGFPAFSYFSKICVHSFFYITEKERKHHMTIEKYQNEIYDEMELEGLIVQTESDTIGD